MLAVSKMPIILIGLIIIRGLLGVLILLAPLLQFSMLFAAIPLLLLSFAIHYRNAYTVNGSDQLNNITQLALCVALVFKQSVVVQFSSCCFIAFQAELSYLTSGVYKLINVGWRDGSFLRSVLSTRVFGNRWLKSAFDLVPNKTYYILFSFVIIFGEILLGLAFAVPPELSIIILAIGLLFHLSIAVIMGLNTFIWAFLGTYPSIYLIAQYLNYPGALT